MASGEGKEEIDVYESPSAEPVRFTVNWLEQIKISLLKKDQDTDEPVAGAVYGIYKDSQCKELVDGNTGDRRKRKNSQWVF